MWLWVRILLLSALYVVVGLLPALSVIPAAAVPPLADMQFSEGTISTRSVTKVGALTRLTKAGGEKEVFACRDSLIGTRSCIHPRYAGAVGQIHWFWVKTPLGERYKFPGQIVVNGEVLRDRSTVIEELEDARIVLQFMYGPLAFFCFAAVVFMMVVKKGTVTDVAQRSD